MGRSIDVMSLICSLGHCAWDGNKVHKLSQRRLTAEWLAPRESDCSRMYSNVSSDWLPSYIKATRPVIEIFKMAGLSGQPAYCCRETVPSCIPVSIHELRSRQIYHSVPESLLLTEMCGNKFRHIQDTNDNIGAETCCCSAYQQNCAVRVKMIILWCTDRWRQPGSSETSTHTYQTTKLYAVRDSCLRVHSRKNPKTHPVLFTVFSHMCLSYTNDVYTSRPTDTVYG